MSRCTKPTPSSWVLAFIFATWTEIVFAVHWYTREGEGVWIWYHVFRGVIQKLNLKHFLGKLFVRIFTDWWIGERNRTQGGEGVYAQYQSPTKVLHFYMQLRLQQMFQTVLFIPKIQNVTRWLTLLGFSAKALLCLWGICCLASQPISNWSPIHSSR